MSKTYKKAVIWGFLFGTVGMYILAALSLILQPVERTAAFLFIPERFIAEKFAGTEGSNLEVLLLVAFNGVFYALVFLLISALFKKAVRRDDVQG